MKLLLFIAISALSSPAFSAPEPLKVSAPTLPYAPQQGLQSTASAPAPTDSQLPPVTANALIEQRLAAIDALLAKKDYPGAIQTSLSMFSLNASSCRGIDTHEINFRDDLGNAIVAHTRLDQIIVFDPRQVAFRNARMLVAVLAHEIAHCDQNQKMYAMSLATDKELAPLKDKIPLLRVLADLDEVANVAAETGTVKADPKVRAEAQVKFKALMAKHGLDLSPERLIAMSKRFVDNVAIYKRTLGDLHEMEASLKAFEVPGILTPPAASEPKASDEFALQYRFLLLSTNKFLRARMLLGTSQEVMCKLVNAVPFDQALQQERNCVESLRLIRSYFTKVPN